MATERDLIELLASIRHTLPDNKALTFKTMYKAWKVGIEITQEDIDNGDNRYQDAGILWRCLQPHITQETWIPSDSPSLWAKVLIPDPDVIPEWEQPDSTNGYSKGEKVTHNDKTWESLVDGNVWEPGATGTESLWKEVTE